MARRSRKSPSTPPAPAPPAPASQQTSHLLLLVLALAVLLRLGYFFELRHAPDFNAPQADAGFHHYWATGLVTGDWTPPEGLDDPQIASAPCLRPPGYPYFLAVVYAMGGPNLVLVRVVQFLLGVTSCYLAYLLGSALFGRPTGLVAALLLATSGMLIYFEGELQEIVLLVALLLATLLALHQWALRPGLFRAAFAGVLLGLCTISRPNFLLIIPIVLLWAFWILRRQPRGPARPAQLITLAAGAAVVIGAITTRNLVVSGETVLISCNGAINLYIGNNPLADGYSATVPDIARWTGTTGWSWFHYGHIRRGLSQEQGRPLSYSDVANHFQRLAHAYIAAHPARCAQLAARRAFLFWGPAIVSNNKVVALERANALSLRFLPGFSLVAGLALLGLVLALRNPPQVAAADATHPARRATILLMLVIVAVYFASFLPFLVAERMRAPLLPILAIFAAYALVEVVYQWRTRQFRSALTWTVVGVIALGLAYVPVIPYAPDEIAWRMSRGSAYHYRGQTDRARREFETAIALAPGRADPHVFLADVLAEAGQIQEAVRHYQLALQIDPGHTDARRGLAELQARHGSIDAAIADYRAAIALSPNDPVLHYNLGRALLVRGDTAGAEPVLRRALELNPRHAPTLVNLAHVLSSTGRPADAEAALRQALQLDPNQAEAHFNLGNLLAARGDVSGAQAEYAAALQANPAFYQAQVNLALLQQRQGDIAAALATLRAAAAAHPESFEVQLTLAGALAQNGLTAEARAAVRRALQLQPGHAQATALLRQLETGAPNPRP